MRNIPVFTTEFGVASLLLKEIPYTGRAYVRLLSSLSPVELVRECADFCRAAGAEAVYAAGADLSEAFPLHTKVVRMTVCKDMLPLTEAVAYPVLPQEADDWRKLYNRAMADVDNASYMDDMDVKQMLQRQDGYFVYLQGKRIGIGRASGDCILAVVSLIPGSGRDTVLALAEKLNSRHLSLEVASTNRRAIRLYENLGFTAKEERSCWYRIL